MDDRSSIAPLPTPSAVMDAESFDDDESLEERIRRLERAIAALTKTPDLIEDRVVERLKTEWKPTQVVSGTTIPQTVIDILPKEAASGLRMMDTLKSLRPSSWLFFEILFDIRDAFGMYFDSRYRKTVTFQMMLPMLFGAFLFSQFLLSSLIGKFVDIFIILLGYKVLMREVVRYRELIGPLSDPEE